jgi:hypothetical protein
MNAKILRKAVDLIKRGANWTRLELENHGFFLEKCAQCGKTFNALKEGKIRMNETFCSLECCDKAYPNFNQRNK